MITVEGFAFVISLLIALLFINRAYRKAVENADQRRNFLLSITHELKSPLASLRLASETILRKDLRPEQMRLLASNNLKDTWELILSKLELPSTRMLLSQQAELESFDSEKITIALSPNWENMIKSRKLIIENTVKYSVN